MQAPTIAIRPKNRGPVVRVNTHGGGGGGGGANPAGAIGNLQYKLTAHAFGGCFDGNYDYSLFNARYGFGIVNGRINDDNTRPPGVLQLEGGTGFTVGDVVTVIGGNNDMTLRVESLTTGKTGPDAIYYYSILTLGSGYLDAVQYNLAGGTGHGAWIVFTTDHMANAKVTIGRGEVPYYKDYKDYNRITNGFFETVTEPVPGWTYGSAWAWDAVNGRMKYQGYYGTIGVFHDAIYYLGGGLGYTVGDILTIDKSMMMGVPVGRRIGATYGSEQVTNGTFASDASWTKGSWWSIAEGVAYCGPEMPEELVTNGDFSLITDWVLGSYGGDPIQLTGGHIHVEQSYPTFHSPSLQQTSRDVTEGEFYLLSFDLTGASTIGSGDPENQAKYIEIWLGSGSISGCYPVYIGPNLIEPIEGTNYVLLQCHNGTSLNFAFEGSMNINIDNISLTAANMLSQAVGSFTETAHVSFDITADTGSVIVLARSTLAMTFTQKLVAATEGTITYDLPAQGTTTIYVAGIFGLGYHEAPAWIDNVSAKEVLADPPAGAEDATLRVDSVDTDGEILTWTMLTGGLNYTLGNIAGTLSGGTGSGATVEINELAIDCLVSLGTLQYDVHYYTGWNCYESTGSANGYIALGAFGSGNTMANGFGNLSEFTSWSGVDTRVIISPPQEPYEGEFAVYYVEVMPAQFSPLAIKASYSPFSQYAYIDANGDQSGDIYLELPATSGTLALSGSGTVAVPLVASYSVGNSGGTWYVNPGSYNITKFYSITSAFTIGQPQDGNNDGMSHIIELQSGDVYDLTWDYHYVASDDLELPSATIAGETTYLGFIYEATSGYWVLVASQSVIVSTP